MEKHVVIGMSDEYETAAIYPTNGRDRGGGGGGELRNVSSGKEGMLFFRWMR